MNRLVEVRWGGKAYNGQRLGGFGFLRVGPLMVTFIPKARSALVWGWVGRCWRAAWGPLVVTYFSGGRSRAG